MISVKCATCGRSIQAQDHYAGRSAKCPNCGSPIAIPAASPAPPNPGVQPPPVPPQTSPPPQPAGQTIVVQMQQQQPGPGLIGPARKSVFMVFFLNWLCQGVQYFYLGQMGKGILFTLLTLLFWVPLIAFTCGLGLLLYLPFSLLLLIDSIVVCNRMRSRAISQWRFF